MKKILQCLVFLTLFVLFTSTSLAFQVRINGVDVTRDFSVTQVVLGVLASHAAHELGHYTMAKYYSAGPRIDRAVVVHKGETKSECLWISRGGYLGQTLVGCALTTIPTTRGSDFTTAFTGYTAMHQWAYAATDGFQADHFSDTKNISKWGGHGKLEMITFGTVSAYLTYLNLNQ